MSASFLLLRVTVHFAPLGCIPTLLVSEPALGATRTLICSYSCVFLPPMSLAIRTSAFSFVGALNVFYIFQRHGVCLVDHVDLICSLYSWWEDFGSSSFAALPLSFNCGFFPPLHLSHPLGFAPEASLKDLGLPSEGQVWRWCSCLGFRGSGSTRYSEELAARAAGNIVL